MEGTVDLLALLPLTMTARADAVNFQWKQEMSTQSTLTLQDTFLKHLRDHRTEVTMFLVNGIRLQGQIRWFDNFTVQLVRGNGTQIVYKHAISAIHPAEPVELTEIAP
jgi:host factor-I protein